VTTTEKQTRVDRSPGPSYQDILDTDTHVVPDILRMRGADDIGPLEIPTDWYLSRDIYETEKQRIWRRRWQMACREEDIPDVGDTWVYDVADLSILVVRSEPATVKAFYNSCLHRGRSLRDFRARPTTFSVRSTDSPGASTGARSGSPATGTSRTLTASDFHLPELLVGTWGGFVFVNPDPAAEPLTDFIGELDHQFSRWPLAQRYKSAHVAKVITPTGSWPRRHSWSPTTTITTHPELLPSLGDANSQYDAFGIFRARYHRRHFPAPTSPERSASKRFSTVRP